MLYVLCFMFSRHRIVSAFIPWMAPQDSFGSQKDALERTVPLNCFISILAAARMKTASHMGQVLAEKSMIRRQCFLVDLYQK
jgi:hypothetical protein